MTATVLVFGESGHVARALGALRSDDLVFHMLGRSSVDLLDQATGERRIEKVLASIRPAFLVNAAAYTAVDAAEAEPNRAFSLNCDAAGRVAAVAARHVLPLIHLSTDYVFSGNKPGLHVETDVTRPLNVYGRSKLEGEALVTAVHPDAVILRTAWVYDAVGINFLTTLIRRAGDADRISVVGDQWGSPTYAPDLAVAIAVVIRQRLAGPSQASMRGLFHLAGEGGTSRAAFAAELFRQSARIGGPTAFVEPIASSAYPTPARRPANSQLSSDRFHHVFGHVLPGWKAGIARCLDVMQNR